MDNKLSYSRRYQGLQGFWVMIDLQGMLINNKASGKNQRIVDKLRFLVADCE